MRQKPKHRWLRGQVLAVLVAYACLLQALIPAGWMPSQGGELVICTSQGAVVKALTDFESPFKRAPQHSPTDKHDSPCVFAGHATGATLPGLVGAAALPASPYLTQIVPDASFQFPGRGLAAPPPPSHAPPLTA